MTHVPTWLQCALLPDRWDVCGVRCRALSVWHHFILEMRGNPYLCGQPTDRDSASEMLLYASRGHAEGKRLYVQPYYRARARKAVCARLRRMEWADVDAACWQYVSDCCRVPQHTDPPVAMGSAAKGAPKPRKASAPLGWILVQFLAAGNPAAIESAWDTPYATARCMFDAHRDIKGETETLEDMGLEARNDARAEQRKGAA